MIEELTLIRLEYNNYNGFIIELCSFSTDSVTRSLFGLNFSNNYMYLSLFFVNFIIFDNDE